MLEQLNNRKKAVFCVFLVVGIIVVLVGLGITIKGYCDHEKASSNPSLQPIPTNQIKTPETIPTGSQISNVIIEYQTNDGILSANYPFNYTITAVVNNPDQFNKIVALPWTVVNGMSLPTTDFVMSTLKNGTLTFDNITLNRIPNKNGFYGSKINEIVSTERNLGFFLIPYTNGTPRGGLFIYQQDPLIIHPQVDELQAQTDRDIQKQNIDSTESNAYVFGLTVVIIGFILIGLPLEFIVHGWLLREDKKDNTKFSRLDENPNYLLVG
ncbi:MAG TPA: hypothetical protein VEU72_07460 [Nitrosopumilaceae archaeon]|nr:hypothetical protein [Nitrosopumilaceae archaeon]